MSLKLLHVVGDSKFGGGAVIILRLAEMARAMGWQVDVLTTDEAFQAACRASDLGVVDIDVIRREIKPRDDWRGVKLLQQYLEEHPYDIVHTHTSKAGFIGRLAARRAGSPIIVHTAHGFAFREDSSRKSIIAYSFLERMAARWCDRMVTVSEFHREWAIELGIAPADRLTAVPNGIAPERVTPEKGREATRAEWGLHGELAIVTIGRLAPQKGLEYLLEAAARLKNRMPVPFKLVLAGDGPMREELERLTAEKRLTDTVTFLGFRTDIGDLLSAADIIALPTEREGLSIALLEAMAAGKPIVTTTIGSNREVNRHGEVTLLAPPRDVDALAEALLKLASSPDAACELGRRAQAVYRERYTEQRMLQGYQTVYRELLEERRASLDDAISVRPATEADLGAIVRLHQAAFPGFFLTNLGPHFLAAYYRLVLTYPSGLLLLAEIAGKPVGFVGGFPNPEKFYARMSAQKKRMILPILRGVARNPAILPRVMASAGQVARGERGHAVHEGDPVELSSIATDPRQAGRGVGKKLLTAFNEAARAIGADYIVLTTDAKENDAVNAFYRKAGFTLARTFTMAIGREMNEYIYELNPIPAQKE